MSRSWAEGQAPVTDADLTGHFREATVGSLEDAAARLLEGLTPTTDAASAVSLGDHAVPGTSASFDSAQGVSPVEIGALLDLDPERVMAAAGRMLGQSSQFDPTGTGLKQGEGHGNRSTADALEGFDPAMLHTPESAVDPAVDAAGSQGVDVLDLARLAEVAGALTQGQQDPYGLATPSMPGLPEADEALASSPDVAGSAGDVDLVSATHRAGLGLPPVEIPGMPSSLEPNIETPSATPETGMPGDLTGALVRSGWVPPLPTSEPMPQVTDVPVDLAGLTDPAALGSQALVDPGMDDLGLLGGDAASFADFLRTLGGPADVASAEDTVAEPTGSVEAAVGEALMPSAAFDVNSVRKDFPILHTKVHGKPLIWFDNGATTQKPNAMIDAISEFYREYNSNIHRGAHALAARATDAYEDGRKKVRDFIKAQFSEEIVFVRGTTEGVNLVAQTYGKSKVEAGDEIIVSCLEHHSNIVPWQMLAKEKGASIKVIPVNARGEIRMDDYEQLFTSKTRIVAVTHASNALGTVPPVKEMVRIAHRHGVCVLVDGAQAIPHLPVDVQDLDCDFYVFSAHKLFAPTGIGCVYGKKELLEEMPPWQGGGNMIVDVTFDETVYNVLPEKFEAGTPNIADVIGLGAAIDYLNNVGMDNIARYEQELLEYGTRRLLEVEGLRLIGTAREKIGVLGFVMDGVGNEVVGKELDREGIAVRVGHHCAQPILRNFGFEGTVRPALALYNTKEEIDHMIDVLQYVRKQHPLMT